MARCIEAPRDVQRFSRKRRRKRSTLLLTLHFCKEEPGARPTNNLKNEVRDSLVKVVRNEVVT